MNSTAAGIAVGAVFGLLFAWLVAMMPQPDGSHYYVQIMIPGFITGAIIGFLTQTNGDCPKRIDLCQDQCHFEIPAENPERLIAFYESIFGWTFQKWEHGPMPTGYHDRA